MVNKDTSSILKVISKSMGIIEFRINDWHSLASWAQRTITYEDQCVTTGGMTDILTPYS